MGTLRISIPRVDGSSHGIEKFSIGILLEKIAWYRFSRSNASSLLQSPMSIFIFEALNFIPILDDR
jgi:hypothetical protein